MACSGRYAEAYQYADFWYNDVILVSDDKSGVAGNAFLTDDQVNFVNLGCTVGRGHELTNITSGVATEYLTAVQNHLLYANGMTFDDGDQYRLSLLTLIERAGIESALDLSAGDIHSALMSVNACNCSFSTAALDYLKKLNCIIAASYYHRNCGTPRFTDEMKGQYLEFANNQLALIRSGEVELCEGYTGSTFPAMGWADQSVTEFNAAQIIVNDIIRNL